MSSESTIDRVIPQGRFARGLKQLAIICVGICLSSAWAISAQAQEFSVNQASAKLLDSVYRLDADLDYRLSPPMLDALQNGVVLTVELEIEVYRSRNYWWDETIARLEQRYEIQYYALTEQYLLHNLNSGSKTSYSSLDTLLFYLGMVRQLPLIDANLLDTREQYQARIRAGVDFGSLPVPLQLSAYVSGDWSKSSDWYSWRLGKR